MSIKTVDNGKGVKGSIWAPDSTVTTEQGLLINVLHLTNNNPNKISLPPVRKSNQPLIGVTLHNTNTLNGSLISAGLTTPAEQYTRATINGNMGTVVVHYYVDDISAWEIYPDTHQGWHSATGTNGQGNCNTISIEACGANATENAAKLIAHLFKKHNWTIQSNLFTHNYWTNYLDGYTSGNIDQRNTRKVTSRRVNPNGKYCPSFILPTWDSFKQLVTKYTSIQTETATNASVGTAKYAVGSSVVIKAGAVDKYGKTCSSQYAGSGAPLTVKSVTKDLLYTLYVGNTPMYIIAESWLAPTAAVVTHTPAPVVRTFETGKSQVRLKSNAVWWGTNKSAVNSVTRNMIYYLQEWNHSTGRAVFGTTPRSSGSTTTGAVDIKYLDLV